MAACWMFLVALNLCYLWTWQREPQSKLKHVIVVLVRNVKCFYFVFDSEQIWFFSSVEKTHKIQEPVRIPHFLWIHTNSEMVNPAGKHSCEGLKHLPDRACSNIILSVRSTNARDVQRTWRWHGRGLRGEWINMCILCFVGSFVFADVVHPLRMTLEVPLGSWTRRFKPLTLRWHRKTYAMLAKVFKFTEFKFDVWNWKHQRCVNFRPLQRKILLEKPWCLVDFVQQYFENVLLKCGKVKLCKTFLEVHIHVFNF